MRAFDFFCGAGGLTRGLLDAGIDVVAGIDNDESCCDTYKRNNPNTKFIHRDVNDVALSDLGLESPLPEGNDVLFAGCAPCQPFSQLRKTGNKIPETTLLGTFTRLVRMALPTYVLVENVPGIARVPGFSTFRRVLRQLDDLGYQYKHAVLNAKCYGVPQNRRRLVLLAARGRSVSLPKPSHGIDSHPFKTVREAIVHYPQITAGGQHLSIPNHVSASISELNMRRLEETPHDGGDRMSWPKTLQLACHSGNHKGHTDVYGRMYWNKPAPTLTGRCISISNGRYGHPEQNRAISLREAAALQSFPDEYEFFGATTKISMQIGNAVPVTMAEKLGKHILQLSADKT